MSQDSTPKFSVVFSDEASALARERFGVVSVEDLEPLTPVEIDAYTDCIALLNAPGTHEQKTSNVLARMRALYGVR